MKILLLIQSKKKDITVEKLALEFGVSRRTIFRDLRTLVDMEVPIAFEEGEGYSIPRGYNIPPIMFTTKEIATIMIGLSFVKSQQDRQMVDDAQAVQLKIKNIIPREHRGQVESLDQYLIVDPYVRFGSEKTEGGDWYTISRALSEKMKISFIYQESPEPRKVSPYAIIYYSDHWNVIGYCFSRKGIRNFRMDKMKRLEVIPESFSAEEIPGNPERLIFGGTENYFDIRVKVNSEAWPEFRKTLPAKIEKAETKKAFFKVHFRFDNLEFINRWLLRFGDLVEVLEPAELTELREKLLREMLSNSKS